MAGREFPPLDDITQAMTDRLAVACASEERPKQEPWAHYASRAAHACRFYLWALRKRWEEIPSPDLFLRTIFQLGNEVEESVQGKLRRAGYAFQRQQMSFRDDDLNLSGRIDGFMLHQDFEAKIREAGYEVPHGWPGVPTEIKGFSPTYADECVSFEAMLASSRSNVRMTPGQVLLYAYLERATTPLVCIVIRNKASGRTWPVIDWTERWFDELLRIGENLGAVNRHLREGTIPRPIPYDPVWCDRCDAAGVCPMMIALRGRGSISLDGNPGFGELLRAMVETEGGAKAHERAKGQVKAYLERTGNWPDEAGRLVTVVSSGHMAQVEAKGKPGAVKRYLTVAKAGGAP